MNEATARVYSAPMQDAMPSSLNHVPLQVRYMLEGLSAVEDAFAALTAALNLALRPEDPRAMALVGEDVGVEERSMLAHDLSGINNRLRALADRIGDINSRVDL